MRKLNFKKVLFGLSVSLVLAMAIGSFALSENQTPVTPQAETQSIETNADTGDFVVEGGSYGEDADYHFESTTDPDSGNVDRVLYIHPQNAETKITISNEGRTTDRIEVTSAATITLNNVNIEADYGAAVKIKDNADFDVSIIIANDSVNTLKGKAWDYDGTEEVGAPGIEKSYYDDVETKDLGTLTIGGTGKLEATGGFKVAGIGGGCFYDAAGYRTFCNGGKISIADGNITANGGLFGAGIGGGNKKNGSDITIFGGTVTANGGNAAAGIGGGSEGSGADITITGGEVIATGGVDYEAGGGAGIGGGAAGNGTDITISGGSVIATSEYGAAGIGGGYGGNGTNITISGGSITATGGYIEGGSEKYSGAGIGSGVMGSASNNKLSGNAVVLAISGEDNSAGGSPIVKPLDGFADDDITGGILFEGEGRYEFVPNPDHDHPDAGTWVLKSTTWNEGKQYGGSVKLTEDVTFPADFTITSNAALTIGKNADGKEATLSMAEGKKLTVEGSLTNEGVIDIPAEKILCNGTGEITTLLNYDPQGGEIITTNDEYITYQNASGVQTYGTMPSAEKDEVCFDGWYSEKKGEGTKVDATSNVLLNAHVLYANWTTEPGPEPTPTPPTPTPPGPEPDPTPTPEPTPDPSVNPDGDGSGSGGASSKTSDPFMEGTALALLGITATGAVILRKRK